ncbi:ubiquitin elongating factor core [Anopheles sinensis]|uniref:Ubiquitin elongating factor core n=1 Tax=Anopheles sinensis TaxID=74873 RepID=A0A084WBZ9_ANOSI|nr:ubiquitin elongating factor core [Anopheles sinensis]
MSVSGKEEAGRGLLCPRRWPLKVNQFVPRPVTARTATARRLGRAGNYALLLPFDRQRRPPSEARSNPGASGGKTASGEHAKSASKEERAPDG